MSLTEETERKTMAVAGGTFTHVTLVSLRTLTPPAASDAVKPAPMATCHTRRPATRCECGMFSLAWMREGER